jgi:hypothetical protein
MGGRCEGEGVKIGWDEHGHMMISHGKEGYVVVSHDLECIKFFSVPGRSVLLPMIMPCSFPFSEKPQFSIVCISSFGKIVSAWIKIATQSHHVLFRHFLSP